MFNLRRFDSNSFRQIASLMSNEVIIRGEVIIYFRILAVRYWKIRELHAMKSHLWKILSYFWKYLALSPLKSRLFQGWNLETWHASNRSSPCIHMSERWSRGTLNNIPSINQSEVGIYIVTMWRKFWRSQTGQIRCHTM